MSFHSVQLNPSPFEHCGRKREDSNSLLPTIIFMYALHKISQVIKNKIVHDKKCDIWDITYKIKHNLLSSTRIITFNKKIVLIPFIFKWV